MRVTSLSLRFLVCVLAAVLGTANAAEAGPVVRVGAQHMIGAREANGVAVFRGLAYARPPVGALRWAAPRPPIVRRGRVDATRFGPACAQDDGNARWYRRVAKAMQANPAAIPDLARESEDCLYLNVWTPAPRVRTSAGRMPVMVWVHGGSNANGYSHEPNYLGAALARQGVVVVSLNYRVGLLGFFAHPALGRDASGRQGLLDQIAALTWVKAHIAPFGGDPDKVTVFGESAGGTDIAVLAGMPEARGLFRQIILQSAYVAPDAVMTRAEAAKFAFGLFDPAITKTKLQAIPWQEIVALQGRSLRGQFYAPVAQVPMNPAISMLIGTNADENLMYQPEGDAAQQAALDAELAGLSPPAREGAANLLNSLPGGLPARLDAASAGKGFHCPTARMADAAAARGHGVYVYRFERVRPGPHGLGAYHGAEIPYAMGTADTWLPGDETDRQLSRTMQAYWVNFARTGDPNAPGLPLWPRWQAAAPRLLGLGDRIVQKPMPLAALCPLFNAQ